MEFDYSHPRTEVRFGRGRRDEVGELAAQHGDSALVVTTRSAMQDAGFLDDVLTSLESEGVSATVYEDVQPNPTVEDVIDTVDAVEGEDTDAVVALGGGSPTDTAKSAALALAEFDSTPSPDELWEFAPDLAAMDGFSLGVVSTPVEEAVLDTRKTGQTSKRVGTPVAGGKALEEHAPVEPEGEDVYDIRTSLEHDLEIYGDIIESLREHIDLAANLGDHATSEILRQILVEVEEDAHHIEHYLEGDTLVTQGSMH